jgi:hypothetical protein
VPENVLCDIPLTASGLKEDKGSTGTIKENHIYEERSGNKFTMNIRFVYFIFGCKKNDSPVMNRCPTAFPHYLHHN